MPGIRAIVDRAEPPQTWAMIRARVVGDNRTLVLQIVRVSAWSSWLVSSVKNWVANCTPVRESGGSKPMAVSAVAKSVRISAMRVFLVASVSSRVNYCRPNIA